MTDREQAEVLTPQQEISAAQLLASSLDPREPEFAKKLEEQLDKGGKLDDVLLNPDNSLVKSTEYLFQIEPHQFSSIAQPYVEAIINEAEAMRSDGKPVNVDVTLDINAITIKGNGKGMDFKKNFVGQVIRPHSGDEGKVRGQFGQGTKSYWLAGENVRISSVPEDGGARGFDVGLNNNSADAKKGKTIGVKLHQPTTVPIESGTTVVFDKPMANGKPVSAEDLSYIADYIKQAVEHVYYAKINLNIGGKTEVVNKRAIEAPRFHSGKVEVIIIPAGNNETVDKDVLAAIDVAGESLWQENNLPTSEQLVINFPRQRMKAEARSFNHLSLLEEDASAVADLIKQITASEYTPPERAKYLGAISRQLEHLQTQDVSFSEAQQLLVKEITTLAEAKTIQLFPAWSGTENLIFPNNTILIGETISKLVPENLRTAALPKVEFQGRNAMYAAAFEEGKSEEFFVKIGPAACVNTAIVEVARNQDQKVKNSLRTALNTSLIHYNYTHPLAKEQIQGNFTSTEYVIASQLSQAAIRPELQTTEVKRVTLSTDGSETKTETTLQPGTLKPIAETNTIQPELTEHLRSVLEKLPISTSWQEQLSRATVRELDAYTRYVIRIVQKNPLAQAEYISEDELKAAVTNMWGSVEERLKIENAVTSLKPEELLTQVNSNYSEVFSDFLTYFSEKDVNHSKEFQRILENIDKEANYDSFNRAVEEGGNAGTVLMIWLSGHETQYFYRNDSRFVGTSIDDRAELIDSLGKMWQTFVAEKPEAARLLRTGLLSLNVAKRNDISSTRFALINDLPNVKAFFAQDVDADLKGILSRREEGLRADAVNRPGGIPESRIQEILKSKSDNYFADTETRLEERSRSSNLLLKVDCDDRMLQKLKAAPQEFLEIYKILQKEFKAYRDTGLENIDVTAIAAIDFTIGMIAFIEKNADVSISEILLTHQNCERMGLPSILSMISKELSKHNGNNFYPKELNFRNFSIFETLGKEKDPKRLEMLSDVVHQVGEVYSVDVEENASDIYKRVLYLCLPLLKFYTDDAEFKKAALTLIKVTEKNPLFDIRSTTIENNEVAKYLFLFQLEPEAFPVFQKLVEKDDRTLSVLLFLKSEKALPDLGLYQTPKANFLEPGTMIKYLMATEHILKYLPENADLSTLKKESNETLSVMVNKEKVTLELGETKIFELLKEKMATDTEWVPPTDGSAIEGDLVELTAVYLSLKAENQDLTQLSTTQIAELTKKMSQTLSADQKKYYQRRLLSTIQSQDSNQYRFYREWFQNSQNAAVNKSAFDRYAVTLQGLSHNKSGELRRFTKMVDFNGMSADKAIWNLGTSPGFKEGDADSGSLERFHAGWLTSLNGAAEVRVKTSTGNGKVLFRRFLPQYEVNEGQKKLVGVKQQTWEVTDSNATTAFTEMTRFEQISEQSVFKNPIVPIINDAARYHDLTELGMYEVKDDSDFTVENIDLTTDQIDKLKTGVGVVHHQKMGNSESGLARLRTEDLAGRHEPLVRRGEWGIDLVTPEKGKKADLLVQGGFALGDHWPEEITRLIPAEVLQAFHDSNKVLILRIPHDISPNKARDSINNAEAFIRENKNLIASLLIEAVAQAIAQKRIGEGVLLSYDAGSDFLRRYSAEDQKSKQALIDLQNGKKEGAAAIFESDTPGRELSKLALHLPIFRLPDRLPGVSTESLKREFSLYDLMIIRAGAAYLLNYELKNNSKVGEIISQLVEKDANGTPKQDADGTMILSEEALIRMAWMARPETQIMNRARLAKFKVQEKLESNQLFGKIEKKLRSLTLLSRFARRGEAEATEKKKVEEPPVQMKAEATPEEIAALFKGEGKKHVQAASEVNTVLEIEKNANVLPIRTLKADRVPKADENAYFGLAGLTVLAVHAIEPTVQFDKGNVGFYIETEIESRARAGGNLLAFNISELPQNAGSGQEAMTTILFKEALQQNNMSALLSEKIGGTIAHEVTHNQEDNWKSNDRVAHPTHDATFRKMEDRNFRKLCKELFAADQSGVAKIQTVWQDLQALYSGQELVAGSEFYKRLS